MIIHVMHALKRGQAEEINSVLGFITHTWPRITHYQHWQYRDPVFASWIRNHMGMHYLGYFAITNVYVSVRQQCGEHSLNSQIKLREMSWYRRASVPRQNIWFNVTERDLLHPPFLLGSTCLSLFFGIASCADRSRCVLLFNGGGEVN